ncbi:hypothetical protein N3K66_007172 [Trichothecium roseum]|uniref:Uncharacterized protein n=1 Tax=Trichothecium roseum TaxID=47278 RepID=A0ACC0UUH6_9HYPO|nr:hypothetical protein N3K66_007172 [Trichothecium roseum]
MKFLAVLSILSIGALADSSWYEPERDVTCVGEQATGNILCQPGHIDNAPVVDVSELQSRDIGVLEKRVSCNIQVGPVDGCFLHCFALNYCNAYCDDKNTCICRCFDNGAICTDTTCN